ncbi:hypothetical protein CEUSTIGMA_g12510.t1 [Chlamydomonas eustigma]|uniref:CHCH domain-containing protein n=1 Tax=Chlamydomonas eustigma TaxID=1157962 RepID=A0A250XQL5_9CHLO|nr:hypothetical protein CEUSTIGMA_g12510.t1 [Chlamydomonas eustigma]|eukprot:GAX85090.1 hypothetical protein CEUSTIGMA_g12510.t1 [Chlamydomonas eustigma]
MSETNSLRSSSVTDEAVLPMNLEASIKEALDCPCVKDLRDGPCGSFFIAAFTCYHRSQDVIKGAECFQQNVQFANCLAEHPEVAYDVKRSGAETSSVSVPALPPEHSRLDIAPAQNS